MSTKKIARTSKTAKPSKPSKALAKPSKAAKPAPSTGKLLPGGKTKPAKTKIAPKPRTVFAGARNNLRLSGIVSIAQTNKTQHPVWLLAKLELPIRYMNAVSGKMEITHYHQPIKLFVDSATAMQLDAVARLGALRDDNRRKLEASTPNASSAAK